jgi:hypothetical protein
MKSSQQLGSSHDSASIKTPEPKPNNARSKTMGWLMKLGWAGFLFFLIKGLVWLAVFYGLGRFVGL